MMRCRNSAGYGRWLFGIVDTPFRPNHGVSTKPGQLHTALQYGDASGPFVFAAAPRDTIMASEARDEHRISRAAYPGACLPVGSLEVRCPHRAHLARSRRVLSVLQGTIEKVTSLSFTGMAPQVLQVTLDHRSRPALSLARCRARFFISVRVVRALAGVDCGDHHRPFPGGRPSHENTSTLSCCNVFACSNSVPGVSRRVRPSRWRRASSMARAIVMPALCNSSPVMM